MRAERAGVAQRLADQMSNRNAGRATALQPDKVLRHKALSKFKAYDPEHENILVGPVFVILVTMYPSASVGTSKLLT